MEVTIQCYNTNSFLLARSWHYWFPTHRTPWGKFLVEIFDAVNVAGCVHGERNAIQTAEAHYTNEALRVIGFPGSSQDPLHDWLGTDTALLQRAYVAGLTKCLLFYSIKRLATQFAVTGHAGEALNVEHLVHSCASCTFSYNVFPTARTATKILFGRRVLHVIQHLLSKSIQLILRPQNRTPGRVGCLGLRWRWWNVRRISYISLLTTWRCI